MQPSPSAQPQLRIWGPLGHTLVHTVAFLVVAIVFLYGVPHFEKIFRDFDAELPVVTQWTLGLSQWFVANWFLTIPLLFVDGAILFGLSQLPGRAAGLATAYSLLVMLTAIAALAFLTLSLFLPLIALVQKLS